MRRSLYIYFFSAAQCRRASNIRFGISLRESIIRSLQVLGLCHQPQAQQYHLQQGSKQEYVANIHFDKREYPEELSIGAIFVFLQDLATSSEVNTMHSESSRQFPEPAHKLRLLAVTC